MSLFLSRSVVGMLLLVPTLALGGELEDLKEKNARLEATVEELTLKLADAIKDRKRLESELATALNNQPVASQAPSAVVVEESISGDGRSSSVQNKRAEIGCGIDAVFSGYDGSGDANEKVRDWLKDASNRAQCSDDQLSQVRGKIRWDFYGYSTQAIAYIDKELKQRGK